MLRIRHACLLSALTMTGCSSTLTYSQNVPRQVPAIAEAHSATVGLKPFELRPAKIGVPYMYALETNRRAQFEKADGNANWLTVTADGVLMGTPTGATPQKAEITVYAYALNVVGNREASAPLVRTFSVPVQPDNCLSNGSGSLAWCDDPQLDFDKVRPSRENRFSFAPQGAKDAGAFVAACISAGGCILQFDRLGSPGKRFGYYDPQENRIEWFKGDLPSGLPADSIIRAINGSKVFLSGSVLFHKDVGACRFWAWSVVTQTEDSSNNLVYGPGLHVCIPGLESLLLQLSPIGK